MINKFLRENDGAASIEFAMWMPLMGLILMMGADATMLMHRQTLLYDGARDAARQVVTGYTNEAGAESAMASRFGTSDSKVTSSGGYVTAEVSVPFADVAAFTGRIFDNQTLTARVVMWQGGEVEETNDGDQAGS